MGKKLTDAERMYVAIDKISVQPVIDEIHHNPLWLFAFVVLFFVLGNLFEILWMMLRDLRRFLFRLSRYPARKMRAVATKIRHSLSKRYGKKTREGRKWKK